MANGLYLYGIFPAPGPKNLHLAGLDKQPVYVQDIDGFAFLYSEAQQGRYLASRKNLLGHEQVLEQAMRHGYRTVLPLQFGLVISDWNAVKEQLTDPKEAELKQLLTKLVGRREVSIKISWETNQELERLMQENAQLRAERDRLDGKHLTMDEVIHIGQTIEQAMEGRKQNVIEQFRQRLNPLSIECIENEVLTDAMIYNAVYLIDWDIEPQFSEQVEALDHQFENRLRIRYNNFTAPFNFAQFSSK